MFVNLPFYLLVVRSNYIFVTFRPISLTVLESQEGSSLHLLPTAFDVERQAPGTFLQSIKFIKHLFLDLICLPWISKSQKSRHSNRHSYLLQAPAGDISPGLHMLQGPRLRHTVKFRTNLAHMLQILTIVTLSFKIICKEDRHQIDCTGSILKFTAFYLSSHSHCTCSSEALCL